MSSTLNHLDVPAIHQTIIEPGKGWINLQLKAVWQYRELLYFLAWRDIKIRYKQTLLGVAWILFQPLINMLIFSGLFGVLLEVPSGNIPYPAFMFAGLLPWQYFASALSKSSTSLVDSANLVTKVYFPRLIVPLSAVISGLVDFAIAFVLLILLMMYYHIPVSGAILLLPLFLLLAMITALSFGLWLSALNVRYRDVKYMIPFLVQAWMYVTPVVYGANLIPERFRWLLGLNPMTAVVEGFRWALFGYTEEAQAAGPIFLVSLIITFLALVSGAIFFRQTERTFADII